MVPFFVVGGLVILGGWLWGASMVVNKKTPLTPIDPHAGQTFATGKLFAKNGQEIKLGSVIEVDMLTLEDNPAVIAMVPVMGGLNRGVLTPTQHIDDTMIFRVTDLRPIQPLSKTPSILAVLFDSRFSFAPGTNGQTKQLFIGMGNEIPVSVIEAVDPERPFP